VEHDHPDQTPPPGPPAGPSGYRGDYPGGDYPGGGYPQRHYHYHPHSDYWSNIFNRQFSYPGRLGPLGSLFVLLAIVFTAAFTAWVFLWHAVNHGLAQEGAVNTAVRFFAYIFTLALFDYAMIKAAKLVSQPKHRHGPPPRDYDRTY
jgi:hypothetical protein